jgi:hypothetical protein
MELKEVRRISHLTWAGTFTPFLPLNLEPALILSPPISFAFTTA